MVVPFIAFAVILFVNRLNGNDVTDLLGLCSLYFDCHCCIFLWPGKTCENIGDSVCTGTDIMLIGVFTNGIMSVYAFMAGGLFCSVMWPCIFSLGVGGLGKYTSQGSAFLIMMILGGAVIPPFQGALGDNPEQLVCIILTSIAAVCFAFLAWLALKLRSVLRCAET